MTEYLDSKRIMGTNADRTGTDAVSGGWVELGRTTLGSAGDTITVSSLADKRYYQVLVDAQVDSDVNQTFRIGNGSADSGSNYSNRYSSNGGSDSTTTSQSQTVSSAQAANSLLFSNTYISNLSGKEKLGMTWGVSSDSSAASASPDRRESVWKWVNTSNPLDVIQAYNSSTGSYQTGAEVVVLGYDPDDTHTNNFWEELASVDLSGGAADEVSSGTISAKKYLWVQFFGEASGSIQEIFRFNNDTGSNYARRMSSDGGADGTDTSVSSCSTGSADSTNHFYNLFIINNSSNEKLIIGHQIRAGSAGAGNAPNRREYVWKWANTSSQITEIDVGNNSTGDFGTNSFLKVWGAD